MGKRLRLEEKRDQAPVGDPQPGTAVKIAVDLSRSKWVYCVRWQGAERLRLSTGGEIKHLQALVRRYAGCPVHLAFEACGFGYELAWWAHAEQIAVTVIAPSRMERAPGGRVKTDRLDAGRMARQLEDGSLKGIYVPERAGHERRQVVRTYGQAVKERKRAQVRLRSLLQEHGRIGPAPRAGWKPYREWRRRPAAARGRAAVRGDVAGDAEPGRPAGPGAGAPPAGDGPQPGLSPDRRGVVHPAGRRCALRHPIHSGDRRRAPLPDGGLDRALSGVTPSEYSSGDTLQRGHILKCGPGSLRAAMLQCGWASVRKGGDATLRAALRRSRELTHFRSRRMTQAAI